MKNTEIYAAIKKATSKVISQEPNNITKGRMRTIVADSLSMLKDQGVLKNFSIEHCELKHNKKKFFGRVLDWIKWKSPLRKYFYKPKYVKIEVTDIFQSFYEQGHLDIGKEDFNMICKWFYGVTTWKEVYPEDPYITVDIDVKIMPTAPIEFIKQEVTLQP